jgi:N-methylhydantoinase A
VHACEVAELLKSECVIFPPLASVYSAFGSLVTPTRLDLVRSELSRLDDIDWDRAATRFDEMERTLVETLADAGCRRADVVFSYAADLRYHGQHYDVMLDLERRPDAAGGAAMIRRRFEDEYARRYRIIQSDVAVEVVNWRLSASSAARFAPDFAGPRQVSGAAARRRRVHLWQDDQEMPVMPRAALAPLGSVAGPVILEEAETTLVIPPGWSAATGKLGCVIARRGG